MKSFSRNVTQAHYVRNFIFGVEDSLVSTVGLLTGIAVAGVPQKTIVVTGLILILVEAFSMAVGSFLSEHSAEDFAAGTETRSGMPVAGGVVMLFSYFLSGFIPLSPYVVFMPGIAVWISIVLSLGALFSLGIISARLAGIPRMKSGIRMLVVGGSASLLGILAGALLNGL